MTVATSSVCAHADCGAEADPRSGAESTCLLHWTSAEKPRDEVRRQVQSELAAGRADFRGCIFPEKSDLSGLTVPEDGSFERAVIGSGTSFDGSTVGDGACFREAMFGTRVTFRNAKLGDRVSFVNATFAGGLTFEGTVVGDGARFLGAHFGMKATFRDVTFGHDAWFRNAEFAAEAWLEFVTFGDRVSFQNTEMPETTWLETRLGEDASLRGFRAEGARLLNVAFGERACFENATLQGTVVLEGRLGGASFRETDVSGVEFRGCDLRGADLQLAVVDGRTLLHECRLDGADFTGVGLTTMRLYPSEQLSEVEYTMRRLSWERWYRSPRLGADRNPGTVALMRAMHWIRVLLVRGFWGLSDYGRSTGRLVSWFLGLVLGFAVIYLLPTGAFFLDGGGLDLAPLVVGLEEPLAESGSRGTLVIRAVYFSVVTMTTLGFGDVVAEPSNPWGHLVVGLQVILGYMMLGALVTRLGILFQSHSR